MQKLLLIAFIGIALSGCVSDSDDDPNMDKDMHHDGHAVPTVSAQATYDELAHFSTTYSERADNLPAHTGARDYMAQVFEDAGLEVYRQNFTNGIYQENIIGIKWGTHTDKFVVIGGHYDMTTTDCIAGGLTPDPLPDCVLRPLSQGAYDDGSGTTMTLNLARAFSNVSTDYSLMFVAFDGEERGLQGSGALATAFLEGTLPWNDGQNTAVAMLNLDMIGLNWPAVDVPIYFDTNSVDLRDFTDETRKNMSMPDEAIKYQGISLGRSDYAHFFAMGVPTGFFISDFEEYQLPADIPATNPQGTGLPVIGAYPFWHVEDTMTTMDLMSGGPDQTVAGFQTILDLSAEIIYKLGHDAEMMHAEIA
ncbi:MAG: M28 family metallopeptidase [Thermoplasmatota archaeon]